MDRPEVDAFTCGLMDAVESVYREACAEHGSESVHHLFPRAMKEVIQRGIWLGFQRGQLADAEELRLLRGLEANRREHREFRRIGIASLPDLERYEEGWLDELDRHREGR